MDRIYTTGPGVGGIKVFKTTITQAQYRASKTTPITLIAAPGTNKVINIIGQAALSCTGGGYDFGGGTTMIGWSSSHNHFDLDAYNSMDESILLLPIAGYGAHGFESNVAISAPLKLATYGGTDSAVGTGTVTISFLYNVLDVT